MHLDETTPHMHLNLIPITPDGRLCSKDLFDKPKLQQLQTDIYEAVGKKYGLQRDREGSQAKYNIVKYLVYLKFKVKRICLSQWQIDGFQNLWVFLMKKLKNCMRYCFA